MRVDVTAVLRAGGPPERSAVVRAALERSTARPASLVECPALDRPGLDVPGERALAEAPPSAGGWLWLLLDGAVPEPEALEELLACAAARPDAALLGPAIVDADDPRRLLELGLTVDGAGRRRTGVEPGELDQGQHDGPREVLAVSTAGALVRRDVWAALGGLDPALTPSSADVDLGWRVRAAGHAVLVAPAARVRRTAHLPPGDRSARLVPLLHAGRAHLPLALLRSAVAVVLRALLLLLTRRPGAAAAELRSLRVLADPRALGEGRRRRRATRTAPTAHVRRLLVRPGDRLRTQVAEAAERLAGAADRARPRLRPGPAGLLVAALTAVALLAERSLLGPGRLTGGLLPLPDGASGLWAAYAGPAGDARLGLLALLSTATAGRGDVAVELLLLAAVPLAGLSAWTAAAHVVREPRLRTWLALTWALLPAVTGTVGAGRLDLAVLAAALPLLLVLGWSVLVRDPRADGWRRVWALALGLLLVGALAPQVLLASTVLLLLPAGAAALAGARGARRRLVACATAVLVPVLVLLPATGSQVQPAAGTASVLDLLLAPGPAGLRPAVLCAGLLVGGVGGLLRGGRPRLALGGWGLVLSGLLPRVEPATGLLLVHAGLLLAVVACAHGLAERVARASFGRRQIAVLVLGAATAGVPVLCAGVWVAAGADGALARRTPVELPAFVAADLADDATSALVLRPRPDGAVGAAVTGPRAAVTGPLGPPPGPAGDRPVQRAVTDLLAGGESGAAAVLGRRGVAWVALTDADPGLAAALDAEPGLSRQLGGPPLLWRVTAAVTPVAAGPPQTGRVVLQGLALLVLVVLAAAPARPAGDRTVP